jgi:hypothetical protein
MRIAITAQGGTKDFKFSGAPWDVFKSTLEGFGHAVVSIDSNPDFLIMNNFSRSARRRSGLSNKKNLILIVWEPPSNKPQNFNERSLSKIGCVFFPSPIWVEKYGGRFFWWPQGDEGPQKEIPWGKRVNQFCFIQANRWSVYPGERYSFRRNILRAMNSEIEIFGSRWNEGIIRDALRILRASMIRSNWAKVSWSGFNGLGSSFSNYNGVTENKIETLSKHKFSLVIENSNEYVSEKLIDAILAKTVPLYIGADLEKCGFPSGIALECDAQIDSVAKAMMTLKENSKLCSTILSHGEKFIKSKAFLDMKNELVLRTLATDISEYIDAQ